MLTIILINCYRTLQCAVDNFTSALLENLPPLVPDIIVCGNFNSPLFQWPEGTIIAGETQEKQTQSRLLLELSEKFFLIQVITMPTIINNTLDLFFTNNKDMVVNCSVDETIFSDQPFITINTTYSEVRTSPKHSYFHSWTSFLQLANWLESLQHLSQCNGLGPATWRKRPQQNV